MIRRLRERNIYPELVEEGENLLTTVEKQETVFVNFFLNVETVLSTERLTSELKHKKTAFIMEN